MYSVKLIKVNCLPLNVQVYINIAQTNKKKVFLIHFQIALTKKRKGRINLIETTKCKKSTHRYITKDLKEMTKIISYDVQIYKI